MAIDGRFIGVAIDDMFFACEMNSSFSQENEMLEIASQGRKGFRNYIYGYKGWSLTVTAVMNNGTFPSSWNKILEKITQTNDPFDVVWKTQDNYSEAMYIKGKAIVPSFSAEAPNDNKATYSVTFQGCGELEMYADEVWLQINAMPAPADKDIIVNMN